MLQMIEANWLAFVIVLLIGIAVAWWLFRRGSTIQSPRERKPDALDEGAAPAGRNQALIDAPPAADLTPPPGAGTMAGLGEIIAVAAQDEVEEQAVRETEATPPAPSDAGATDDLGKIKGVGPKLVALLASLGITRFDQIAGWSEEDLDSIDAQLGTFAGRARRDSWVEQAKLLASGDTGAYEAKFGNL
ncbi:MAG: hypothetical protein P8J20_14585 [Novosphingobium sp.]|nr:hypothetical protein [Novosphingobium sp.]